jgi:hypothetical protein
VQPVSGDVALLIGKSVHTAKSDWESFAVMAVDDKFISGSAGSDSAKVALTPESHRLVVQATFNRQFNGGGPYEAFVALSFSPQIGGAYRLGGKVRDNMIDVWIEDHLTGEAVSEISSAPYQTQPQVPVSVYSPIYVQPVSLPAVAVRVH